MNKLADEIADILAERERQIVVEGYTPYHDDWHTHDELIHAARCYLLAALRSDGVTSMPAHFPPNEWPWTEGWNPSANTIRNLVKAGALITAEIARLKRKELSDGED